jgi:hypothetical protein
LDFPEHTIADGGGAQRSRQPAARIADPARDLGLIEIRDSKPVDVTEIDVIKNPGGIKIVRASPARPVSPPHGLRIHK